jgi:hypothetical protein
MKGGIGYVLRTCGSSPLLESSQLPARYIDVTVAFSKKDCAEKLGRFRGAGRRKIRRLARIYPRMIFMLPFNVEIDISTWVFENYFNKHYRASHFFIATLLQD